jgi:type III pantothenate kinase
VVKIAVIDIGNTRASMGLYRQGAVSRVQAVPSDLTDRLTVERWLASVRPDRVVIASVVPAVEGRWKRLLKAADLKAVLWVDHRCALGVGIDYPKPAQIGADRLANAAAAAHWIGLPAVVCDFGTALTFDVMARDRGYVGGVICPGLSLMFDYLAEKTALLPALKPIRSKAAIGRSTEQAMRIGAERGYRGMVREVLGEIKAELGVRRLSVCATGGHAAWVLKEAGMEMRLEKHLTLLGLGRIADLNPVGLQ